MPYYFEAQLLEELLHHTFTTSAARCSFLRAPAENVAKLPGGIIITVISGMGIATSATSLRQHEKQKEKGKTTGPSRSRSCCAASSTGTAIQHLVNLHPSFKVWLAGAHAVARLLNAGWAAQRVQCPANTSFTASLLHCFSGNTPMCREMP